MFRLQRFIAFFSYFINMIIGIGIDIVRIERIHRMIDRWNRRFLNRIFTKVEQDYAQTFKQPEPHLAARFAVKEAVLKAMGTGWTGGIRWTDVEVYNESSGRPKVKVHGKVKKWIQDHGVTDIQVSISHDTDYSIGQVVLSRT